MSLQTANDKWLPDGLGAVLSGRPAQGELEGHQLNWYINCLELMAVFLALQYFLPQLRGCHVVVLVENTAVVSYINHHVGLRSCNPNRKVRQIFLWAQGSGQCIFLGI